MEYSSREINTNRYYDWHSVKAEGQGQRATKIWSRLKARSHIALLGATLGIASAWITRAIAHFSENVTELDLDN